MDNDEKKLSNMDDQERKQEAPRQILDQVHMDFTIAMALQDQERANNLHILPSIESEEEEEDNDEGDEDDISDEDYSNDYEFFEGFEFEGEMEFSEGQDSNSDDQYMEEDEIDPDELSYEELVALGEFIGEEKRGLSVNDISKFLVPCKYKYLESKNGIGIDKCVICQVEYEEGELLASLPCEHPYHSECISKWLQVRKICPVCSSEVSSPKIAKTA